MKLIYNPNLSSHLSSYGIKVPLCDERSQRTFEFLKESFPMRIFETDITSWKPLTKEQLLTTHSVDFVETLYNKNKVHNELIKCFELFDENGNPQRFDEESATEPLYKMVDGILLQGKASLVSMQEALLEKMCFFLGGGMHHGMYSEGRGFCLINDIVIGIRTLQKKSSIKNVWVIDTDAHKGDGTASLTQDDSSISTLSIHMEKGWPLDEATGGGAWNLPSDIDIPITVGGESEYLQELETGLKKLSKNYPKAELAVVVAGADPFEKDILLSSAGLKLSLQQLLKRDRLVYEFLKDQDIPQCWLMAGGYGEDSWEVYAQFISSIMREAE